jgi:putative ABC transport system permease protein
VVLRPAVPVRPAEVVSLFTAWKTAQRDFRQFSYQELRLLRDGHEVFADVAAVQHVLVGLGEGADRRRSLGFLTSDTFFSLMGTTPELGRFYSEAECRPGANVRVVVASHALWRRMGGRPDFVGSTLRINGEPYTVIGVSRRGFGGAHAILGPELWFPLGVFWKVRAAYADPSSVPDLAAPRNYTLNLVGRLQPGLSLDAARLRLPALARRLTDAQPVEAGGRERELQIFPPSRYNLSTTPSSEGPVKLMGALLMAMAVVVLVIASLNLASMLLARGAARSKEIAVRLAIGASRRRIVRQLLGEGLLLAVLGGAVGLVLSVWSNDLLLGSLARLLPSMSFALVIDLDPGARVLAVTLVVCLLATLLFSLGPALRASRPDLVADLKEEAGDPAGGKPLHRFFAPRHLLVMVQMALSLVLVFSAGLFFRGAQKAGQVALGFDPTAAVVTEVDFTLGPADEAAARRTLGAALERLRALPAVRSAAAGSMLPYGELTSTRRIMAASQAPAEGDAGVNALYTAVSTGYFDTLGVRLLRGRDFTAQEVTSGAPVAILDERMAATLFPGREAVGQRVRYTRARSGAPSELEVVGVVSPHRHDVFSEPARRLFVPLGPAASGSLFLHARLAGGDRRAVLAALPALRQALREVDPQLPIVTMSPFTDLMERNFGLWVVRLCAVLFGVLGAIALLLAVVGVYGVKSYLVVRRTHEIGIRMALGAPRRSVFALVMKQGALQTLVALAAGLALALGAGRLLARLLFQVSPTDPAALLAASLVLAVAGLFACVLPARRATRVTPMSALRSR